MSWNFEAFVGRAWMDQFTLTILCRFNLDLVNYFFFVIVKLCDGEIKRELVYLIRSTRYKIHASAEKRAR